MRIFTLTVLIMLSISTAKATQVEIECRVKENTAVSEAYNPEFHMSAIANLPPIDKYELTQLNSVFIETTGASLSIETLDKDSNYRARTVKNRNRFQFRLEPKSENFDGVIRGILLPKFLSLDQKTFNGILTFSTDSYHDGIVSYAAMNCSILGH